MNVAVRLPNWLGDTVMAVPTLAAIRAAWPDARVLAAGPWATLLRQQGLADVLLEYPRQWTGRLRAADAASEFSPDLAILLPNSMESALAAWYWGARRRVGFAAGARAELLTDAVPVPSPRPHQIDEYLLLVERCGATVTVRDPELAPPAANSAERRDAARLLASAAGESDRWPRVGIHLGAAYGPAKLWPIPRVAELCRLLATDGATAILLGAPADVELGAAVTAMAPAASLVGRDSPALLPAVLAELDVLVSGDTGVAHLAAALGTPVVALFGPTDPALSAPRGRVTVLRSPPPCAPCFYRECPIEHPCMRDIDAARVRAGALAMLERVA